ncbi:MAG: hypothetical protein HYS04_04630 [Acidobacteria bacterium]|nr:hypothetical protein [Acidobacteriota bacterium]
MAATSPRPAWQAQDLTQDLDLSVDELNSVLDLTHKVKRTPERYGKALHGRRPLQILQVLLL